MTSRHAIMTATLGEEESGSGSDRLSATETEDSKGKRKHTEMDQEKDNKRKRNREAAKKCRDRKLQQTESLKKINEELQKENCDLVRQRDELFKKCVGYEEEIRQHREQGCLLPQYSPPYDLVQILDPGTPPSPMTLSTVIPTPTLSPCPSPPPKRRGCDPVPTAYVYGDQPHQERHNDTRDSGRDRNGDRSNDRNRNDDRNNDRNRNKDSDKYRNGSDEKIATSTPRAIVSSLAQAVSPSDQSQRYTLHVRDKHGQPKELCLSYGDYVKVMKRIEALNRQQSQSDTAVNHVVSVADSQLTSTQWNSTVHHNADRFHQSATTAVRENDAFDSNDTDLMMLFNDIMDEKGQEGDMVLVDPNQVLVQNSPMETDMSYVGNVDSVRLEPLTTQDTEVDHRQPGFCDTRASTGEIITDVLRTQTQQELEIDNIQIENSFSSHMNSVSGDETFTITFTAQEMAQMLGQDKAQCSLPTEECGEDRAILEIVNPSVPVLVQPGASFSTTPVSLQPNIVTNSSHKSLYVKEMGEFIAPVRLTNNQLAATKLNNNPLVTKLNNDPPVRSKQDPCIVIKPAMRPAREASLPSVSSLMKTVKLRPNVSQLVASSTTPAPRLPPNSVHVITSVSSVSLDMVHSGQRGLKQHSVQSSQNIATIASKTDPMTDLNSSQMSGVQQHGVMGTSQTVGGNVTACSQPTQNARQHPIPVIPLRHSCRTMSSPFSLHLDQEDEGLIKVPVLTDGADQVLELINVNDIVGST